MSDEGGTVYDNRTQSVSEALLLKLPRLVGTLGSPHHVLTGTLSEHQHHVLAGTLSKHQRTDYYTGEYVVTPSTEEQTLNTAVRKTELRLQLAPLNLSAGQKVSPHRAKRT